MVSTPAITSSSDKLSPVNGSVRCAVGVACSTGVVTVGVDTGVVVLVCGTGVTAVLVDDVDNGGVVVCVCVVDDCVEVVGTVLVTGVV